MVVVHRGRGGGSPGVVHCSAGVGRAGVFTSLLALKGYVHTPLKDLDGRAEESFTLNVSPAFEPLP